MTSAYHFSMLSEVIGGRYQIIRYLGGGGFGRTYLAEDLHLPGNPQCVVKKLMPRVNNAKSFEIARRLFDREAEVLYSLGSHTQIPQLFAHFEENREFYLVQQYVEGTVLSQELKSQQGFNEPHVIDLLCQILSTLSFVHNQNVIHRDIKPSNLIRRQHDQTVVMIDFGGVKQIGVKPVNPDTSTVTVAIGSSGYMPNEQLAGKPRFSSDIYAVGMVGIQMLTGTSPSHLPEDLRTGEILWRDLAPFVSEALADVIDMMTRYDYRQRYQSTHDVLASLLELPGENVAHKTMIEETSGIQSTNSLSLSLPLEETSTSSTQLSHSVQQQTFSESVHSNTPSQITQTSFEAINGYLAWYERGDELFQQQRFQKAAESYNKVVKVIPEDYAVWFKLAMALEHSQQFEEAINAYKQVIQLKTDDYLAWYRQGNTLENLNRLKQAIAAYDYVIQLQPKNYWAWHDRGRVLEKMRHFDSALEAYDRAVQIKADFQLAIDTRKHLLQQMKNLDRLYDLQHYSEAIEACEAIIEEKPDNSNAWLMRSMALEKSNQLKEALTSYHRVITLQPNDHLAWFKQGTLQEKLGLYEDAAKSYHHVTQLQPENCWAWNDYGRALETVHHYEQALESYEEAIKIQADCNSAVEGRHRVLRQLERTKESSSEEVPKNLHLEFPELNQQESRS